MTTTLWRAGLAAAALMLLADQPRAQGPDAVTLAVAGRANSAPWIAAQGRFVAVTWAAAAGAGIRHPCRDQPRRGRHVRRARTGEPRRRRRARRRRNPAARRVARPGRRGRTRGGRRLERQGPAHRDQAGAIHRRRPQLRPAGLAAVGRCGRRSRLARAGPRRSGHGARDLARPPRSRRRQGRRERGQGGRTPAQGRTRRRGDGAAFELALCDVRGAAPRPIARSPPASATAASRRWWRCAGGRLVSAWRHVYEGNLRDIAFTESRDGGATFAKPARVSEDGWAINGCPDDGPALAADAAGGVHIAWPTVIPATSRRARSSTRRCRRRAAFADARAHPDAGQPEALASTGGGGRDWPAIRRLGRVDRWRPDRCVHGGRASRCGGVASARRPAWRPTGPRSIR